MFRKKKEGAKCPLFLLFLELIDREIKYAECIRSINNYLNIFGLC